MSNTIYQSGGNTNRYLDIYSMKHFDGVTLKELLFTSL